MVNFDAVKCFLNRNATAAQVDFDWVKQSVKDELSKRDAAFDKLTYRLVDLWQKMDKGTTKKPYKNTLNGHDVVLLRLVK